MKIFDSVIVGGGPAGLTAAIYLARYNRSCNIVDIGHGRSTSHEINENYMGFPKGIHSTKLRELGLEQAQRYGAQYCQDKTTSIKKKQDIFYLEGGTGRYKGRTVILATGVTDLWPIFENYQDYIGRSLFWCITCDGHKTIGKKVMIVGDTDDAACTALQFLNFTNDIVFVTNQEKRRHRLRNSWKEKLKKFNITLIEGKIKKVHGREGKFHFVEINHGTRVDLDYMFNQQGATPNSELAKELGVAVNENGYIRTDHEQKTNIPGVYAAGDVTRLHSHQIVLASAEGATAGESANYDLYLPHQKWD